MLISREILLAQLGFDLLMLLALLILVRYVLRAESVTQPARQRSAPRSASRGVVMHPASAPVVSTPPELADLVGAAEREEYAAEAALRARLGRFKQRSAH